jgi:hypothetical protein
VFLEGQLRLRMELAAQRHHVVVLLQHSWVNGRASVGVCGLGKGGHWLEKNNHKKYTFVLFSV